MDEQKDVPVVPAHERIVPAPIPQAPIIKKPDQPSGAKSDSAMTPVSHERLAPEPASIIRPPAPVPLDGSRGAAIPRGGMPIHCAKCGVKTQGTPGSTPFNAGPYKGGFLCQECMVLDWADRPEIAADAATRQWIESEARRIRLKRAGEGSKLLYDDGHNRAYLTRRGTVMVDLERVPFGGPDEFDPNRFQSLMRLFEAVRDAEVPGYDWPAKA